MSKQITKIIIKQYEESSLTIEELIQKILKIKSQKPINYNKLAKYIALTRGYVWKNNLSRKYWLDLSVAIEIHWKILSYLFETTISDSKKININYFKFKHRGKNINVLDLPVSEQEYWWFGDDP